MVRSFIMNGEKPELGSVFIAESIFEGDNPWDGRTRYGLHVSLEGALDALKDFADPGDPLTCTRDDEAAEPSKRATYMVHRMSERPRIDGNLWIFEEELKYP